MEITANALQTVAVGQNVLFTDAPVPSTGCSIIHRPGSGLVSIRGITKQCRARYRVFFGANVAVPTEQSPEPISLAISLDGEPEGTASMIVTPAAADEYFNVSASIFIDVPMNFSYVLTVENTSAIPISVQNANLIVERVA